MDGHAPGSTMLKTDPTPGSDSTSTRPPCSRTTASTQASGHGPRSYIRHLSRAGFIIEMTGQRMENDYIEAADVRIRRTIKR